MSLMNINGESKFEIMEVVDLGIFFSSVRDCGRKVKFLPVAKMIEGLYITPCFHPWLLVIARWELCRELVSKGFLKSLTV